MALLLGVGSLPAEAQQTGTVRGRVVAAGNLRPLVDAQVSIPGTGQGSLTNAQGEFLIVNVPTGYPGEMEDVSDRIRLCIPIANGERQTNPDMGLDHVDPTNPLFRGS